ncbi:hypothetical protein O6H91_Y159500 [Diphasiastrum complanatum]|nr:hypothetical protein O6H91_Y159500 [Diphasiastrum complanatum]
MFSGLRVQTVGNGAKCLPIMLHDTFNQESCRCGILENSLSYTSCPKFVRQEPPHSTQQTNRETNKDHSAGNINVPQPRTTSTADSCNPRYNPAKKTCKTE